MPLSEHYGGSGSKVMKNMKKKYGSKLAQKVFYATENKRKGKKKNTKLAEKGY